MELGEIFVMDKETKVNILYKIAMGQSVDFSASERKELSKYKEGILCEKMPEK